jgi:hypothetical protein
MALAMVTGNPIGIPLPPMFFRRLLGQEVGLTDVRVFDEDWFNVAGHYMRATTDEDILAFSLGEPEPLPGSGLDEPLTIANRDFQMQRAIDNIVTNNSPDQFAQIVEGFFSVIPHEMFRDIRGEDLQAMIVGNMDVAADDLITNLRIAGGVHAEWLHQVIQEFTPYLRQRFLRFVTGLSVVPAGGWSQLGALQVHMVARLESSGRVALPRSQTCFKTLYLPMYESVVEMREILTNVLLHAIEGGMQEL